MMYRRVYSWGLILFSTIFILSGCGTASPTPDITLPQETPVSAPALPTAVQPIAPAASPTSPPAPATTVPPAAGEGTQAADEGTTTPEPTPTRAAPLDLPFLMRIDRISVVVGRGTLLEGRVAHGTLPANGSVEILGPQGQILDSGILAVLVSGIAREQVSVGDYAGILVESAGVTEAAPGMLLSQAGAYDSYEEALQALQ